DSIHSSWMTLVTISCAGLIALQELGSMIIAPISAVLEPDVEQPIRRRRRCRRSLTRLALCALVLSSTHMIAWGQTAIPKHEFRAAWIATVSRLDWPKTNGTENQKAELVALLDDLKALGMNAVFFQVRPEADALYE